MWRFVLVLAAVATLMASMVVFSIWLRQRGSPESKPVGEPHTSTGAEG